MQGDNRSPVSTFWLVASAVMPFGGLVARPLSIVGAVFVLFAFVIAAVEAQPPRA